MFGLDALTSLTGGGGLAASPSSSSVGGPVSTTGATLSGLGKTVGQINFGGRPLESWQWLVGAGVVLALGLVWMRRQ